MAWNWDFCWGYVMGYLACASIKWLREIGWGGR